MSSLGVISSGHWTHGQLMREIRAVKEEWKRVHEYGRRGLAEIVFSVMKSKA